VSVATVTACTGKSELAPFSSDGCSLFPDSAIISEEDWCSCCFEHDIAYWKGGTKAERQRADEALKSCVISKTANEALANVMYEGVRIGGSPYFYNWYRWGYGWGYERKYQPLTEKDIATADSLLQRYYSSTTEPVCQK